MSDWYQPAWWVGGNPYTGMQANLAQNQAATQAVANQAAYSTATSPAAMQGQMPQNLTQDPAHYAAIGAAYGRATGGFGGRSNAIPGAYPAGTVEVSELPPAAGSPVTDYGPDYGPLGGGTSTPYGTDFGPLPPGFYYGGGYNPFTQYANGGFDPFTPYPGTGAPGGPGQSQQPATYNPVYEGTNQVPKTPSVFDTGSGTSYAPTPPTPTYMPPSAYGPSMGMINGQDYSGDPNYANYLAMQQMMGGNRGGGGSASFSERFPTTSNDITPPTSNLPPLIQTGSPATPVQQPPSMPTQPPPPAPSGGDFEWTPGRMSGQHAPGSWGAYTEQYLSSGIHPDQLYSMWQTGQTPQSGMMAAGTSPRDELAEGLARGDRGFAQDVTQLGSNPLPNTLSQNLNQDIYNLGNAYGGDQATRDQLAQMMQGMQPSQPDTGSNLPGGVTFGNMGSGDSFADRYGGFSGSAPANSYNDFKYYNRPGVAWSRSGQPSFPNYPALPAPPQNPYPQQTPIGPSFNPYQPSGPATSFGQYPPNTGFGYPTNSFTNNDSGMLAPQPPQQQQPQQNYPWGTLENKDFSSNATNPYAFQTGA